MMYEGFLDGLSRAGIRLIVPLDLKIPDVESDPATYLLVVTG
jgi:hypothetical protein